MTKYYEKFQWLVLLIFFCNAPGLYSQNLLTLNATSHNGSICPEVAEWTCNLTTRDSTLQFYLADDFNSSLTGETDPFFRSLNITIMLKGPTAFEGVNKSFISRTLIVNNKDLYDQGYPLLICGTHFVRAFHSLNLDIEVPKIPQLIAINFIMNNTASQVFVEIKTATKVYDLFPYCEYRRNSDISIMLEFDGSEVIYLTSPLVNNPDCNNSLCTTRTTLSQNKLSSPFSITMKTTSEFYNSTSFSLTDLQGDFSITQQDCMPVMIRCSISEHLVTNQQCRIQYRRINEKVMSDINLTINQHHLFGVLKSNTAYIIKVTFQLTNGTLTFEKQITTNNEVSCSPSSATTSLIVPVSAAVISLVVCSTGVLICLFIYKSRYFTRKTGTMDTGRRQGGATASTVLPYSGEPENFDQYESFCGEFAFMNENSSFKSEESLALPTLDVKTTTFDPYYSSCKSIDKKGKEHEAKKDTQSKESQRKFSIQETGNRSYNTLERNAMELEYEEMASAKRAFAKGTPEYAELENRKRGQQQLSANLETSHEYATPTNM